MVRSITLIGMCVINIISSIVFINMFGYIGAAFGTALSTIVGHGVIINLYLHKVIGLNIPRLFASVLKGLLPAFLVCLLVGRLITLMIPGRTIGWFILKTILIVLLYGVALLSFGMNEHEKHSILNKRLKENE